MTRDWLGDRALEAAFGSLDELTVGSRLDDY